MEDLLLFPCNGNAAEALDSLDGSLNPIGFVDDNPAKIGTMFLGLPVFGRGAILKFPLAKILAVPGSPKSFIRRSLDIADLNVPTERFATVVHPRASISAHATLGTNILVMAGTVVTSNATVQDHVIILPNSVIHHDVQIGTHTIVCAGVVIAGAVSIGPNCYIGAGARFRNGLTIAPRTLIGMGALVLQSIFEPGGVWAGAPARRLTQPPGT
jgi:sugar O-acyltransferase (sialic acid O-acetyltransferase NeuD family)